MPKKRTDISGDDPIYVLYLAGIVFLLTLIGMAFPH